MTDLEKLITEVADLKDEVRRLREAATPTPFYYPRWVDQPMTPHQSPGWQQPFISIGWPYAPPVWS